MNNSVVIISNNCWGAEIYKEAQLPYNTPFVGLFIPSIDFVRFCNDIPAYLSKSLVFVSQSNYDMYNALLAKKKYPIALLGDVEIHFLHYKDEKEAIEKWDRRLQRMNFDSDKWRIKGCDREIGNWDLYKNLWNRIPYKKVFFSAQQHPDMQSNIWISQFNAQNQVIDGLALYKISKKYFDVKVWIDKGLIRVGIFQKLYTIIRKISR